MFNILMTVIASYVMFLFGIHIFLGMTSSIMGVSFLSYFLTYSHFVNHNYSYIYSYLYENNKEKRDSIILNNGSIYAVSALLFFCFFALFNMDINHVMISLVIFPLLLMITNHFVAAEHKNERQYFVAQWLSWKNIKEKFKIFKAKKDLNQKLKEAQDQLQENEKKIKALMLDNELLKNENQKLMKAVNLETIYSFKEKEH